MSTPTFPSPASLQSYRPIITQQDAADYLRKRRARIDRQWAEKIVADVLDSHAVPKPAHTIRSREQFEALMVEAVLIAQGES